MRRALVPLVCAGALLALPGSSGAKEVVEKAEACGASGCRTQVERPDHLLPFGLVGPTIEIGRGAPPPPRHRTEPSFAITLHIRPGSGVVRARYLPGPGYLRTLARRGPCRRICRTVPRRWVRLTSDEVAAYGSLSEGLVPFGAAAPSVGFTNGEPLMPGGQVLLLAVRGLAALL